MSPRLSWSLPTLEGLLINLGMAAVILVIGWSLSIYAGRAVFALAKRSPRIDPTIVPMVRSTTIWGIRIIVLTAVLARFGVQTASIIAVLGAAGLAIGLALQGTLQNIAAGIMLLALRPLRSGESVSVVGRAEGRVEEVGLFLSRFIQPDGTTITLPNNLVWGSPIINFSRNALRRLELKVGIPYNEKFDSMLDALRTFVTEHEMVEQAPPAQVVINGFQENTVVVILRIWVSAPRYADMQVVLYREVLALLSRAGAVASIG